MSNSEGLFASSKKQRENLSSQEIYLLANPDAELSYQRRMHVARVMAWTAAAVLVVESPTAIVDTYTNSTEIVNSFKQDGPYEAPDTGLLISDETFEPIAAEPAPDALHLSDTFDGLFETRGYNLVVDTTLLIENLKDQEAVIISIDQQRAGDDRPITSGFMMLGALADTEYTYEELFQANTTIIPQSFSHIGDTTLLDFASYNTNEEFIGATIDGLSLDIAGPATLTYTTAVIEGDKVIPVTEKLSEITFSPNEECDDGTRYVSETLLTRSEHQTVCDMFDAYKALIGDDYAVFLDSVYQDGHTDDRVLHSNQTVKLTYPYIGGEKVTDEDFNRVALHEAMHVAFHTALDTDKWFALKADFAFRSLKNATDYKMPAYDKVNNMGVSITEVEKVWATLTESTYIEQGSSHGHPWDNSTEMLSSTAAVLASYPDAFIENYATLTFPQQFAVRNAALLTKELIERYEDSVVTIIPEWDRIAETLQF